MKKVGFQLMALILMLISVLSVSSACGAAGSKAYLREQISKEAEREAAKELAKHMPGIPSFKLDRNEIFEGENVTLRWSTYQADNISIDHGIGSVPPAGQLSLSPTASREHDSVYTMTAANKYGSVTARARTVVMSEDAAPSIMFELTPARVKEGLKARMAWSVAGARSISVDNGVGALTESSGERLITPETAIYTLTATNKAGTSTKSVSIEVIPAGSSN